MLRTAIRPIARTATVALRQPLTRARFPALTRSVVTKRYTVEHEWVAFDDSTGLGTIGITDYAQKALGDVVYVEVSEQGTQVAKGEEMGAVESVKAASDIFAPVGGQIAEVNDALEDQPDLLNKSPEQDGWLAKIKLSNPGEFDELLNEDAYKAHCAGSEEAS